MALEAHEMYGDPDYTDAQVERLKSIYDAAAIFAQVLLESKCLYSEEIEAVAAASAKALTDLGKQIKFPSIIQPNPMSTETMVVEYYEPARRN